MERLAAPPPVARLLVEGRVVKNQTVRTEVFELSGLGVAVMPAPGGEALLGRFCLNP